MLIAVEQGAFADAALGDALRAVRLAPRDRALATRLVYGTLAWQGQLDRAIVQGDRDPAKLDVAVRALLRLALFQLVHLERVPDFAAVNTAVELSKEIKRGAVSGLVNALLRRFLRDGKRTESPPREADVAAYLAAAWSHPPWLVSRWLNELGGDETAALLEANNGAAPTVVRVNRRRADADKVMAALSGRGVGVRRGSYAPDAIIIEAGDDPMVLPRYRDGWFALQGEASQLIVTMLDPLPGMRVLDVCAAPGGKAAAAAERVGTGGRVVALDRNGAGLRLARRSAARLGLDNLFVVRADSCQAPLAAAWCAERVLVDAPCSGLGTLRQHPEIRWRRSAEDIEHLSALQRELLQQGASRVALGGLLVYSTCTISTAENDAVVADFLAANANFSVDDPRPSLSPAAQQLVGADHCLRTFPHRHGLDGFFAVRLKRNA